MASPSGNSSAKSSPTRTTPRDAKEGGLLPAFPAPRRGSDKLEDLDPGGTGHTGGLHRGLETRVAGEPLGVGDRGEVVGHQDVVVVVGALGDTCVGDAVLLMQGGHLG